MIPGGVAVRLRVEIGGKVHEVTSNPGDYRAWVRAHGEPDGEQDWSYEDLLWLAHRICTRLELTDLDLDEFIEGAGDGVLDDLQVPEGQRRSRGR